MGVFLAIIGVLIWVFAANADRVFNGADALGLGMVIIGALLTTRGRGRR